MEKLAHTLAYDGAIMYDTMSGKPLPTERWASATAPTFVMDAEQSGAFFHHTAQALVDLLPDARRRTLAGQDHAVAPESLVPVLVEFFNG